MAHALASSFNFQGRVKKTFYVLTDDKVGAGPRLRPQALLKDASTGGESSSSQAESMDQSAPNGTVSKPASKPAPESSKGLSLSAKLAAKRKLATNDSTDSTDSPSKARR
jgi:hypothetical protein